MEMTRNKYTLGIKLYSPTFGLYRDGVSVDNSEKVGDTDLTLEVIKANISGPVISVIPFAVTGEKAIWGYLSYSARLARPCLTPKAGDLGRLLGRLGRLGGNKGLYASGVTNELNGVGICNGSGRTACGDHIGDTLKVRSSSRIGSRNISPFDKVSILLTICGSLFGRTSPFLPMPGSQIAAALRKSFGNGEFKVSLKMPCTGLSDLLSNNSVRSACVDKFVAIGQ